jgi:DNA helicase HerA-like ATPase
MMNAILVAKGDTPLQLELSLANRHGLIAGATGTGKSVTLRVLAEGFAASGVPVFLSDVKGDMAGIAQPSQRGAKYEAQVKRTGIDPVPRGMPTVFWDLFGEQGHPVRATVSEMGPLLLARLLGLNEIQTGVLNLVFKVADDEGLLLLDLKDLRAMLTHVADNAREYAAGYGNVSAASVGAIQRALLALETEGADKFFGEPALALTDLMLTDAEGRGAVSVLASDRLMQSPRLYGTFLLWLLSELFEELPEVGDVEKPKLVFFFDEAHLLFDDAPAALVEKIEQVVRLIRSKGVGVYFVTQSPLDLPESVLGQLGNRVQHALRAFTPRDQRAVRAAAETFRANPKLDVAKAIGELAVGEALVSFLDGSGTPGIVQRAWMAPPASRHGPLTADERRAVIEASPLKGRYDAAVDRPSAYESLRGDAAAEDAAAPADPAQSNPWGAPAAGPTVWKTPPAPRAPGAAPSAGRTRATVPASGGRGGQSIGEAVAKSLARSVASSIGSRIGREIVRGVLGSIMGGGRRR